ncbi:ribosomal protection-like ABC-F family protein [Salibacterium halotolerans]|uniref:Pleuromutilin/lincosamide/streptogramin A transport system ATP-binding/permease protein n=1 Tax=Salibacterium halotolerans TaxID=1884432 RepID=A0A1I5W165_9BACI|nr:ABC-F type ribosomal protection protein [Salibacterium halotolerans]SFQ13403.1 pleuromutilin/lincosamide/streptogramin A transport system ATP-binding/permease protein [Salibacterium halotolerans]
MSLIHLQDIRLDVKERTLCTIDRLSIHEGDKIGLVGPNGSGKTSLLELIAGKKEPSSGTVIQRAAVSMIPQLKPRLSDKSGGEISQTVIQEIFSEDPDVLLADEPTTHLDTGSVEKLEEKLKRWNGAFIVVSHDRAFLDALCTQIWEIEDENVKVFTGGYTDYEEQKEAKRRHHEKEYKKYIDTKKQLEEALHQKEQQAQRAVKKPKNVSASEARMTKPHFAKKQKKLSKDADAVETRLHQLKEVERPKELPPINMQVVEQESLQHRPIIRGWNVEGHIGDKLLWEAFDFSISGGDKVALIGPNGSGKTTFLRMILDESGGIQAAPAVSFGYFSQMLEILEEGESILDNVRRTSFQDQTMIRTVLGRLGFFQDDVFKLVKDLSGGERVKTAFAKLFVSGANVLILDEPTNYLDIRALEALESLLRDYSGTVLFVSHDRRFLEKTATRIFAMNNKHVTVFDRSYQEYLHTEPDVDHDPIQDELLMVETKISEVLSRLSIAPSDALDEEFQQLLKKKNDLKQQLDKS